MSLGCVRFLMKRQKLQGEARVHARVRERKEAAGAEDCAQASPGGWGRSISASHVTRERRRCATAAEQQELGPSAYPLHLRMEHLRRCALHCQLRTAAPRSPHESHSSALFGGSPLPVVEQTTTTWHVLLNPAACIIHERACSARTASNRDAALALKRRGEATVLAHLAFGCERARGTPAKSAPPSHSKERASSCIREQPLRSECSARVGKRTAGKKGATTSCESRGEPALRAD